MVEMNFFHFVKSVVDDNEKNTPMHLKDVVTL